MALEWWAAMMAQPCRLPGCGHVELCPEIQLKEVICNSCVLQSAPQHSASPDLVPSPDLTWPWAACKKTRLLSFIGTSTSSRAAAVETVGDLVATISSMQPHAIRLRTAPLQPHVRPPAAGTFLVWRAATASCTVRSGTVELPDGAVLLLAGRGAHFHGTTFRGGVVMCAGEHFSGSFHECTFLGAAVYAVHGAAVTLRDCTVHRSQPGLTASGGATTVTLSTSFIRECRTGIVAEAGAHVTAHNCHITSVVSSGVVVNGAGSHAALEESTVSGQSMGIHFMKAAALVVHGGAAQLRSCAASTLRTIAYGAHASTSIELHSVTAMASYEGVVLAAHARALVRGCSFTSGSLTDKEFATGLTVRAAREGTRASSGGACMQAERCSFQGWACGPRGISADARGAVAALLCLFEGSAEVLKTEEGGSRVTLSHCTGTAPGYCLVAESARDELRLRGGSYEGNVTACVVANGAKLAAVGCEFRSREHLKVRGVVFFNDGSAGWLLRCRVRKGPIGVLCSHATVSIIDTEVSDMRVVVPDRRDRTGRLMQAAAGILVLGGHTTVKGGTIQRCVVGVEAQNGEHGRSHVTVDGVTCTDCFIGVLPKDASEIHVTRCEFLGHRRELPRGRARIDMRNTRFPDEDNTVVLFEEYSSGSVSHSTGSGYLHGVQNASVHEVAVRHCKFTVADGGLCFKAIGGLVVEDCTGQGAPGAHAHGARVLDQASCTLRRCRFNDLGGTGIQTADDCCVTAVDVAISGRGEAGISVVDEVKLALQDCSVSGAGVGIALSGHGCSIRAKRVTLEATGTQVSATTQLPPKPNGSRAMMGLKMVDCVLRGGQAGVVEVAPVDILLLRCQLLNSHHAVHLCGPSRTRMTECRVEGSNVGVAVGLDGEELSMPCPVCMRGGNAAVSTALGALSGESGVARDGARCAHEGSVARLIINESSVAKCQSAMMVYPHGHVEAEGVTLKQCATGFVVQYILARSRFSGCRAVGCSISSMETRMMGPSEQQAMPTEIAEIEVLAAVM